ncbi:bifunctional UDP-N-acetylglucosamine diphosphorylase/glucosamine-1-phosphate N-acetyltransferase GlmU [Aneurinibacillus aneurinilyticus]|jgi:bifunctional UDP-N-acetylglucosamine pyrophosphorylase/glucosamine-1-phosphate N-acetyltransferase|uniref:Bifunctional protein GlmU n=2 Tax=Aneurinibacillus aneurinilyticus TaxID=1391 RepID=A0A848D012_ANEAE|nr:bifunctional UDP-N-acetylglucosamine diphosphorylase/glucosamine-1-phosphate N-acetyltransferase GlmU [Aneurinibacillus aneurinilyticus]ERI08772.1 UDP-N-acetylglucosamine diphosphorylase/glucosamine-1-phosphate N-acetyltransferase [Aneurinibacillus aneurinilyticus ATCC 12856]MCI1695337.1 bifunctional UDP-N-acetylglucosamine diphosphorylase/glucosamine-1-phosphate N-acetyltransferase GlmU [Aneurinibacillus aneurinilyticus]MED0671595.1 bifunctional UDP-N-acetylglucosamine diphosphorylase/glucos
MSDKFAVVLAAGQGTRMKSKLYKVLHSVCGKPMVQHVVDSLNELQTDRIVVVVGHGADKVKEQLGNDVEYAMQEEQLGTAHAVMQVAPILKGRKGTTLVLSGDEPLISSETLEALVAHHEANQAAATILTRVMDNPTGYGRIIRGEDGGVERIVEQKDATEEEQRVKEINTGTYCFDNEKLFAILEKVDNNNAQGEYYLPDAVEILKNQGERIEASITEEITIGVNDRVALAKAESMMRERILTKHMKEGVTIIDPSNTYIETDVAIGRDCIIYPGTLIGAGTVIGEECIIGPHTQLMNCQVGDRVEIKQSVLVDSRVDSEATVGPFAYIRPNSHIGEGAKVGDFVEIKNTSLGKGSKVSHLTYLGDAEVGADVNVGCGTVTVNYDGVNKYKTVIKDRSFVGCNANLVAPVTVGEGAYVAAGSTVTDDVPDGALAIARERQTNKEGYAKNIREK